MVILQVLGYGSKKFGGLENFMLQLCKADNGNKYIFLYDEYPKSQIYIDEITTAGGIIEVLDGRGYKLFTNSILFLRLLIKYKPRIVHFHFNNQYCIWGGIARCFGVKYLFKTIHGCVYRKGIQVENLKQLGVKQRILTLNGLIFSIIKRTVCVSEYVEKQMKIIFGDKYCFDFAYLGVKDPIFFTNRQKSNLRRELSILENDIVLTSIMFASKMKGGDVLIKAFAQLKSVANIKLILIGLEPEHYYTQELIGLAKVLGVLNNIRWIGITDNVSQYLNITDIYVQPSRSEALSLSAVEALSYSVPVIGSNVGGLPEVSTLLFVNEDSIDLANKLESLINSPELRSKHSCEAYSIFEKKMSIKKGVEYYKKLYEII